MLMEELEENTDMKRECLDTQWIVDYAWQLGEDGFVFTRSWISQ